MAKLKAVLLDLDGTLRDTREAIYSAYQQTIKDHTGYHAPRDELKPHVHHHSVVHKAFAQDVEEADFRKTYSGYVDQPILDSPLYDGVQELLDTLKKSGYTLALVTTASHGNLEKYLESADIADTFDAIVGMMPGRRPKPAPDLLSAALEELDCKPDEAVMVGDMTVDVQAAHAAGVRCIGITHGFATKAELEAAGAEYTIDSLAELAALIEKIEAA